MPRTVAIVLAPDYSSELEALAFRAPVWLVDTPENRAAAELAWHAANDWPHITVTLFRPPGAHPSKDDWKTLIEQIAFQEKPADAIEVVGSELTLAARAAFTEAGFARIDDIARGFRARR